MIKKGTIQFCLFLLGLTVGYLFCSRTNSYLQIDRTIAFSWGDSKYGPAFYGAHLFLAPISNGYSARGRIYIARGATYYHDLGELGQVSSLEDGAKKWGKISWTNDGLELGSGESKLIISKQELENHR